MSKCLAVPLFFIALLFSCTSTKNLDTDVIAYENAFSQIKKLQKKPDSQKRWDKLLFHYTNSAEWFKNEISIEKQSDNKFKWNNVVSQMEMMNELTDSIFTIYGAQEHFNIAVRYDTELDSAKKLAATELYNASVDLIENYPDRPMAMKMSLIYMVRAKLYDPTIEGIDEKLEGLREKVPQSK